MIGDNSSPDHLTVHDRCCIQTKRAGRCALLLAALAILSAGTAGAQELEPRAYRTIPTGLNFVILAYRYSTGNVVTDPSLPIEDLDVDLQIPTVGYLRSFGMLGRSASVTATVPFAFISGSALYHGEVISDSRSGSGDMRLRLAVNVLGGPALTPAEFARYRQGRNVGVSLTVSAPTGQYDPTRIINFGNNRWGFKPEIGYSSIRGPWIFEAAAGVWFLTDNDDFLGATKSQDPIGSFQAHLSYNFKGGVWLGVDGNWYTGGRTSIDGVEKDDLQKNSRVGATLSLPLGGAHSLKLAAHTGAYTSAGADFDELTLAYQYRW
ncbi:MAG TPA: transporter [Thermoanaerobaculales bacterium]|nr:transporter [Thermoanaerobaculales bacterium]HQL30158.1 transporter [Thermoanaerobaculales bacterium]